MVVPRVRTKYTEFQREIQINSKFEFGSAVCACGLRAILFGCLSVICLDVRQLVSA
jgi:hypothetical protein